MLTVVMKLMIKLTMMAMLTTAVMLKMVLLVTECMGWSSDVSTRTVPPPIHWSGQSEVAEHETFTRKIKKEPKKMKTLKVSPSKGSAGNFWSGYQIYEITPPRLLLRCKSM